MILSLETATRNCSVALINSKNGELTIKEQFSEKYSHAEQLNIFIEEVLKSAGKSFSDLEAISISEGPGSYTGLRIGVSTAKGLCYALNVPLIAVGTLPAMTRGAVNKHPDYSVYVPMIDARRMEVFTQSFEKTGAHIDELRAEIVEPYSFDHLTDRKTLFFGDGAQKCAGILNSENFHFVVDFHPSAKDVALIAKEKFDKGEFEDVAYFEPFYLKDFIAGPPPKSQKGQAHN